MNDSLRNPLKRRTLGDRLNQIRPSVLQSVSALAVLAMLAGGIWLYRQDAPLAGQPVVAMKISPLEKIPTASAPAKVEAEKPAGEENSAIPQIPPEPEIYAPPTRQGVAIIQRPGRITARPLRRAPVKAVSERGPFGTLPKVARNGRRPFDVYASKLSNDILTSGRPKIVLVIGGMGINLKLTEQAIKELPGAVTFAFAPYGRNLQRLINKARQKGHEVVLHLPMEPFGYPGINPGPKTLLSEADPLENLKSLQWLMSRFTGYTGVTNYMGSKFTADGGALLPVFSQLKARGLVYFDDGLNGGTLINSIARAANLPNRRADININGDLPYSQLQQTLVDLENLARNKGLAIGVGTGLEATIDAVESWSRELEDRGFLLVPLSLAYRGVKS